ncbi:hypothetical protein JOC77_002285 [Peribacillus deserti]|uniref:Cytosolic protein n=1 Tax=Peribacillus deserti TaxID=673318 RepID=A0ABS2QJD7_9BACI|nr:hypothetical protein [Peribacillus deserti]MBM7692854.1 hypothetical protein [Peribacillus deserti]
MGLLTRYSRVCETSDKNRLPELRTHYYKASSAKAFAAVEEVLRSIDNCRIVNISKDHGEISAELPSPHSFLVVTIVAVQPNETAVDFIISSDKTSLTGMFPSLKKQAVLLYHNLDKKLPYLSAGKAY